MAGLGASADLPIDPSYQGNFLRQILGGEFTLLSYLRQLVAEDERDAERFFEYHPQTEFDDLTRTICIAKA